MTAHLGRRRTLVLGYNKGSESGTRGALAGWSGHRRQSGHSSMCRSARPACPSVAGKAVVREGLGRRPSALTRYREVTVPRKSERVLPVTNAATPHRKRATWSMIPPAPNVTLVDYWVLSPMSAITTKVRSPTTNGRTLPRKKFHTFDADHCVGAEGGWTPGAAAPILFSSTFTLEPASASDCSSVGSTGG